MFGRGMETPQSAPANSALSHSPDTHSPDSSRRVFNAKTQKGQGAKAGRASPLPAPPANPRVLIGHERRARSDAPCLAPCLFAYFAYFAVMTGELLSKPFRRSGVSAERRHISKSQPAAQKPWQRNVRQRNGDSALQTPTPHFQHSPAVYSSAYFGLCAFWRRSAETPLRSFESGSASMAFYRAGSCMPLLAPKGWRGQREPVRLERLGALAPQYLHSYLGFSAPSYKACLPLFAPAGWRKRAEAVRLAMLGALVPQYLTRAKEIQ